MGTGIGWCGVPKKTLAIMFQVETTVGVGDGETGGGARGAGGAAAGGTDTSPGGEGATIPGLDQGAGGAEAGVTREGDARPEIIMKEV